MIQKIDGEFCCTCDSCDEQLYGGVIEDWREFIDHVKAEGWLIGKDREGDWVHHCRTCGRG